MKRSAWILLVLFILAVGIYFLIDYRQEKIALTVTDTVVDQAEDLIDDPEAVLTSIRLFDQMRNILVLSRNSEANWEILFPAVGLADQTKVSALESQILLNETQATLRMIFEFLGIDSSIAIKDLSRRNVTNYPVDRPSSVCQYLNEFFAPQNKQLYEEINQDYGW